jgi:intracellular septation protein
MSRRHRLYPFNAEQTVNIASEFGPLVTMFVVNALYGINTGTWALITTTVIAIGTMLYMFRRPPIFPLIASTVTIVFGTFTLITKDPMWVQIKVTIFNALFAGFLFVGLWFKYNFFQYVFEKTFRYTNLGWDTFTRSFAWFFLFTAVLNEIVRLSFQDDAMYSVLGYEMSGVNVWIAFKVMIIMPMSGIYAWILTKSLAQHHMPDPDVRGASTDDASGESAALSVSASAGRGGKIQKEI